MIGQLWNMQDSGTTEVRPAQAVAVKWPLDSPPLMLDPRAQGETGLSLSWMASCSSEAPAGPQARDVACRRRAA